MNTTTQTTTGTILSVRDLDVELRLGSDTVTVVEGISFDVARGQTLGIVGESGSGKSISALAIMGMLPRAARVTSGSVDFLGHDLLRLPSTRMQQLRGQQIGIVFQDPMAYLNPLMTVGAQLEETLRIHGASRRRAAERAVELLALVGVRDPEQRVRSYPHQFSGGMRQRVLIAMAVANNPTLLIADEPTTALDVTVQAGILALLARLRQELGMGLILVSHDIAVVKEVCDEVLVMYAGRIVERGSVTDVMANPRHPYTRELMRSAPRIDLPRTKRLSAIPGQPPDLRQRPEGCRFNPRCPLVFDRCLTEDPPLFERAPGHLAACWLDEVPQAPRAIAPEGGVEAPRRSADPILVVEHVDVGYGARVGGLRRTPRSPVVKDASLEVGPGRTLGLVGESGSGKSTLVKAIVGLLPVWSGSIAIDGVRWSEASATQTAQLRRTVQMVFQDPYQSLNPRQMIKDVIAEPLVVHGLHVNRREARVHELLDQVGLSRRLQDRYSYQLSGGQRQRVGIARALAVEPSLIVADEPVSALDVSVQAQIINLLADLRDHLDLAMLVIAHDLSVVRHLCDEVAVMHGGRIVERAETTTLFNHPTHPYTRALLAATPGSQFEWSDHVQTEGTA